MLSNKGPAATGLSQSPSGILRSSKGLTLLELIVAFLVLQIALVGFAQFITKALDYSRQVRRIEMAQILAQAKMEELLLTLPNADPRASGILNEGPGNFVDMAYGRSEDVDPFRWIAEAAPSNTNPNLTELTLHIYVVGKRTKRETPSEPAEDFFVSDDRERFSYTYVLPDGSVEIIVGRQKLAVSSAVAIP